MPTADIDADRCRMCETALPADGVACPRCGVRFRASAPDPVEVRTVDVVLSVIMAVLAMGATVPMTFPVVKAIALSGTSSITAVEITLVGAWNAIILGIPIIKLCRQWYARVRSGRFEQAWVWRQYWIWQALALSPLWACVGFSVLTRDFRWLWAMVAR